MRKPVSVLSVAAFCLMANTLQAEAFIIHTTFSEDGNGGKSFSISEAGGREAYSEAIAECDQRFADCYATATAGNSVNYTVTVGASTAFYGATGLSVGDSLYIPLKFDYRLLAFGNAHASVAFNNGNGDSASYAADKTGTRIIPLQPGQSIDIRLTSSAGARANAPTHSYHQESYAWADPVVSIDPTWQYAAFTDLLSIDETLSPVEIEMRGTAPTGYVLKIPEDSELPNPIPAQGITPALIQLILSTFLQ